VFLKPPSHFCQKTFDKKLYMFVIKNMCPLGMVAPLLVAPLLVAPLLVAPLLVAPLLVAPLLVAPLLVAPL